MTERRRRPGPFPVIGTAIATFLAVLVLLAVQLQGATTRSWAPHRAPR